jgi:hypothetical protein
MTLMNGYCTLLRARWARVLGPRHGAKYHPALARP